MHFFIIADVFQLKVNWQIAKGLKYIKPSKKIICERYAVGLPALIAQGLMSVMIYGLNIILGMVRESMVTAYGLYYKIQQFIFFATFGLRYAITSIISFHYSMSKKQ